MRHSSVERPRDSVLQVLPYFVAGAANHLVVILLNYVVVHRDTNLIIPGALIGFLVLAFVVLVVSQAVKTRKNAVLVTALTAASAFYLSDLLLLLLGVLWLPGLYQIDYELSEFIPHMIMETTTFSFLVLGAAALLALLARVALTLRDSMRGRMASAGR